MGGIKWSQVATIGLGIVAGMALLAVISRVL